MDVGETGGGATPRVLQKSAEVIDWKRDAGTLFFKECGERLKKKGLTFGDCCKRVERVRRKRGRGRSREAFGKGGNGRAGCNEQTQNIIAWDYWFVKSKMDMKICRTVKY